ncbi:prolyl 4-hydroxylase subunit alpha-1-like [Ylistrum balloti]|uniref:prolyl 4-hydroxylase subunit alpha-1-like n=1 Tax=Ylistrum balloti TaxID=509963 RepID=UPI0029058268|nr:prolyl 4-hydroxylase subunit alpha-1-like [Ylistrum balloti]
MSDLNRSKTFAVEEVKGWPSTTDVKGILGSIIRLWYMYDLDLPALIRGKILHTQTDPLTDREVIEIARKLCESGDNYSGILWLEALLQRKQRDSDGNVSEEIISSRLAQYYNQYDMPWKSVEVLEKFQTNGSKVTRANYKYFKIRAAEIKTARKPFSQISFTNADEKYKELCNRNNQTVSHMSTLRCFLTKTSIPFIRGREEVLNQRPRISMFHDVISKSDIEKIKITSAERFKDSTVVLTAGSTTNVHMRVSQTHWMSENDFTRRLTWKIGILTGLNTTFRKRVSDSEPFQVLNYGSGGMYNPHVDPLQGTQSPDYLVGSGDRLATWMFYLSSVTAGGATVFPRLRVRIPVVEGAAAFWFNLVDDGRVDQRTVHAGCPVLLGSKWVANKWIHSNAQMFVRPCKARHTPYL